MYGLSDKEFDEMTAIFSQCKNLEKVILYGSRAKGNYKPFSDVDITLTGDCLTINDLYKLQDLFYYSDLPYMYDISIFKNITNPDLTDHINRRGIVVWSKS
jgi:predicted nucleotidyltransferase